MVIFGGRSEIGIELAQLLAPGATVVLAARSPDRLSEQVAALEKAGAAKVDVREFDADELTSHAPLVASIVADHGPIGTAVLAFGVLGDQARAEKDPAHAAAVLHTDFVAQANLLTVLADTMKRAGHGRDRRVLVGRRRAGASRQLRLRLGEGGAGRVLQRPLRRAARHRRPAAARAARIRDRADDRGHETGAHVEHATAGCRRHRTGTGQRPSDRVDSVDAAAVLRRDAAAAAVGMAEDAQVIIVIGIGADGMAGLAPASLTELRRATVIYGSQRQLDLLDESVAAVKRPWPSPMLPALRTILEDAGGDVHVVASGDPLLHGVGGSLIRLYGAEQVAVLPHVSSVTLACSRVGWAVQDTEVISLVTAEPQAAVRQGGQAVVMSRDGSTPAELARLLSRTGRGDSEITVLEQLGGPAERRRSSTAAEWAARPPGDVDDLNVIAVRYLPDGRRFAVLPDDAFAHDGQITKQSMRAVTMAALAPRPGEYLWDVGAGSGSIAIEWCRSGMGCRAVAFERDETRRTRIIDNAMAFGVRVEVHFDAPEAFDFVPPPSAIFVGGGLTQPGLLEACYERLAKGKRLVANAVTAESEALLAQWYSQKGGELRRYQHYLGEPLGKFTGWRPAMPVTQWVVTKE